MNRALSLLPDLLLSALAPSTIARKRLRCSGDFSCQSEVKSCPKVTTLAATLDLHLSQPGAQPFSN